MEYCDCGAPVAFSPDGAHCAGCSERRASSDEQEPAWSPWFVSFPNPDGVKCNASVVRTWRRGSLCLGLCWSVKRATGGFVVSFSPEWCAWKVR